MRTETIHLHEGRTDVTLTTYLLDDSVEMRNGRPRPAVVVCPGGAYLFCSDREAEPVALRFVAMGYHAFVLRYSVASANRPGLPMGGFDAGAYPPSRRPGALRDLAKAVRTVKDRAADWKVDPDRIAVCGFSAGGHLCADYATHWHDAALLGHDGDSERHRPAAAILGYPVTDYTSEALRASRDDPFAAKLAEDNAVAFLGTKDPSRAVLEEASPVLHVDARTPPVFLWTTAEDALVPCTQTLRMATALAEARVPFELHIFENGGHGLALADEASAGSRGEVRPDVAVWIDLAETWLGKRFAVELPERSFWVEQAEARG